VRCDRWNNPQFSVVDSVDKPRHVAANDWSRAPVERETASRRREVRRSFLESPRAVT